MWDQAVVADGLCVKVGPGGRKGSRMFVLCSVEGENGEIHAPLAIVNIRATWSLSSADPANEGLHWEKTLHTVLPSDGREESWNGLKVNLELAKDEGWLQGPSGLLLGRIGRSGRRARV